MTWLQHTAQRSRTPERRSISWFDGLATGSGSARLLPDRLRDALTISTADAASEIHERARRAAEAAARERQAAGRERRAAEAIAQRREEAERERRAVEAAAASRARRAAERSEVLSIASWWSGASVALSFLTHLWAEAQLSDWQGGRFGELIAWCTVFGIVLVGLSIERVAADRSIHSEVVVGGAVIGFLAASLVAVVWFALNESTGNWFICPAGAAVGGAISLYVTSERHEAD